MKRENWSMVIMCALAVGAATTSWGISATARNVTVKTYLPNTYVSGEMVIGYAADRGTNAVVSIDGQPLVDTNTLGATKWQPFVLPDSWHTLQLRVGGVAFETKCKWRSLTGGFTVSYANLKGLQGSSISRYREGASQTIPPIGSVRGYAFAGWTPSAITPDMTGNLVVTANWTPNSYKIVYDANGGKGAMDGTMATYDSEATIAKNGFTRANYEFLGWTTIRGGEVLYPEGATALNLAVEQNGCATLYAVWRRTSPIVIPDAKVRPLPPWGLALEYTVNGSETIDPDYSLKVGMTVDGMTCAATNLVGATDCIDGAHRVYWNMAKEGLAVNTTNASISMAYECVSPRYCVIDLGGGATADSYLVTYTNSPPSEGFNSAEYKTTKLVLRRVDAGSFIMGNDLTNESHRVTLTKPFYMGIFEVTQKQWELVMGSNPSRFTTDGAMKPVEQVSYDMIRGTVKGANWPASDAVDGEAEGDTGDSFLGRLRKRTGIKFDLPTEAQWEYACRAGTATAYNYGDIPNDAYMWYELNSSDITHEVGTKKANGLGLYDMHGNAWEWCLDWYGDLAYGQDPLGTSSGSCRVLRSGGWCYNASICASFYRNSYYPSVSSSSSYGIRLTRTLP